MFPAWAVIAGGTAVSFGPDVSQGDLGFYQKSKSKPPNSRSLG